MIAVTFGKLCSISLQPSAPSPLTIPLFEPANVIAQIHRWRAELPNHRLLLGYSGGLDSTVLAHLLHTHATELKLELIHVNHGMQAQSASWAAHCQAIAAQLGIPIHLVSVTVRNQGEGLEAAARKARYQAIKAHFDQPVLLLTAHHQDDQAETVLLKVLSGAGTRGSVGMAAVKAHSGLQIGRPLLAYRRESLQRYAVQEHLHWIEDPSNQSLDYRRNQLRALLPQLKAAFPDLPHTLSLFAEQAQTDRLMLEQLAHAGLARVQSLDPQVLRIADLRAEAPELQPWILRAWLASFGVFHARHWRAAHMLALADSDTGEVKLPAELGGHCIRRFDFCLYFCLSALEFSMPTLHWDGTEAKEIYNLHKKFIGKLTFSGGYQAQSGWHWIVSQRTGGERLKLPGAKHHTSLKSLFQQLRIPPWQRNSMILLHFSDTNELAWVGGIAASERFHALCRRLNCRLTFS